MTDPFDLAQALAWLVGVWHLLVAGWLVFLADKHTRLLSSIAITKGLLGGTIYLVVRRPPWEWYLPFKDELVPLALLLIAIFSVQVTYLIWRAYDLEAPQDLICRYLDACHRFVR